MLGFLGVRGVALVSAGACEGYVKLGATRA